MRDGAAMPAAIPVAGFTPWAVLTALGAVASWALASSLLRHRGLLARWQAAILIFVALTLTAVQGLGALHVLFCGTLEVLAAQLFAAALALALWRAGAGTGAVGTSRLRAGARDLRELAREDLRAPLRLLREAVRDRELLALALLACAIPYGAQALIAFCFRSWTWDPVWYHVPITNFAIQDHSLGFVATPNVRAAGFVRNLELLSVWNVLLPRDSLLDETAQAPFCLLALVSMAAWARQLGASRALAAGLAGCFLLVPPVFIQAASTHVDIACAALLLTTWQQWTGPRFGRAELVAGTVALALYAGTKFTGLFHAGLLAPLLCFRVLIEPQLARGEADAGPRAPGRALRDLAALVPVAFWLGGGLVYLHNLRAHGNPIWPIQTTFLGKSLPGAIDASTEWVPPFFTAPGSFVRMVQSWYELPHDLWPDARGGGFGPLYRWLSMPCVLLVPAIVLFGRQQRRGLAVLGLFALSLVVPDPWWPRFTLCAGAAALGAVLLVAQELRSSWLRRGLLAATLALSCAGIKEGWRALYPLPRVPEALSRDHLGRALLQPIAWLWTEPMCRLREERLRAGDAIAYDDSVFFLSDFWTVDLRNRVVYVQHAADGENRAAAPDPAADARYLENLRAEHARWAAVRPGGHAERALLGLGAQRLFVTPRYSAVVLQLPPPADPR
jgi:hypothetical protein